MSNRTKDAPAAPERRRAICTARSVMQTAMAHVRETLGITDAELIVIMTDEIAVMARAAMVQEWERGE